MLFAVLAITFSNCSKSGDPTPSSTGPVVVSNLDQVKATLKGVWTFKDVTVTQISTGKSATTSTCAKTELAVAGLFTNTNWKSVTVEPIYTFSGINNVSAFYPCLPPSSSQTDPNITWTLIQNSDGTVTFTLSQGDTFIINVSDISPNLIKASKVNTLGYVVVNQFTR